MPAAYSSVDNLLERVRESLEAPRGTGFVAERVEGNLVGTEEVLKRVHVPLVAQQWPDGWSGKGGVTSSGVWHTGVAGSKSGSQVGSAWVAGLPSVSASRIAVIGRQNCQ